MATQTDTLHPTTSSETDRRRPRPSLLWWAAGAGATAGIISLALRRRRQSRWEMAREQAGKLAGKVAENAAREWKPLVGIAAAGTAAAIAYSRRSRTPQWQKSLRRAGQVARETEIKPWMTLAASAAISLASAYSRRRPAARRFPTDGSVDKVAAGALRLVNRAKRVSREVGKLYPQVRKALA